MRWLRERYFARRVFELLRNDFTRVEAKLLRGGAVGIAFASDSTDDSASCEGVGTTTAVCGSFLPVVLDATATSAAISGDDSSRGATPERSVTCGSSFPLGPVAGGGGSEAMLALPASASRS